MARLQAEASEMATDSHGLTVLPFFSGGNSSFAGSGSDQPAAGTLAGVTLRTCRAGILRAILEAVALQLKGVLGSITPILSDTPFEVFRRVPSTQLSPSPLPLYNRPAITILKHCPCLDILVGWLQVFALGDTLLKSPLWRQILADALGVRIHFLSGEKQAAAKGAAILAVSISLS